MSAEVRHSSGLQLCSLSGCEGGQDHGSQCEGGDEVLGVCVCSGVCVGWAWPITQLGVAAADAH